MKNLKTFETWKNNIIDDSLFTSGKAKYNPKVSNHKIKYKTGNIAPYYYATIEKIGLNFICKIYKKVKTGEDSQIKIKSQKDLKSAHNYVREYLNQRLKKKKNHKKRQEDYNINMLEDKPIPNMRKEIDFDKKYEPSIPNFSDFNKSKRKTIIRKY